MSAMTLHRKVIDNRSGLLPPIVVGDPLPAGVTELFFSEDRHGTQFWFKDAEGSILHNPDGPAIKYADGCECWYSENRRHRSGNLPAFTSVDGTKMWYVNGNRHRTNGPAIEFASGAYSYYENGQLHRVDGPARRDGDGNLYWYNHGVLHNENGRPAYVSHDDLKAVYYYMGHFIVGIDLGNMSVLQTEPIWAVKEE